MAIDVKNEDQQDEFKFQQLFRLGKARIPL